MARKELSWILRARDSVTGVLRRVGARLRSFAAGAVRVARRFAQTFGIIGAAMAFFAWRTLRAWSEQQKATQAVRSALAGLGKSASDVAKLTREYRRLSDAIQQQTGRSNESVMQNMALMTQLGVLPNQIESAAKATIALEGAGMRGAMAARAVALALQGEYTMLNRYIPAIRTATSEQEKAAALNEAVTRLYREQQEQMGTLAGGWRALREEFGDFIKQIGEAIDKGGRLGEWLRDMAVRIREFGESPAFQNFLNRLEDGISLIRRTLGAMAAGGKEGRQVWAATANLIKVSLAEGGKTIARMLLEVAPKVGSILQAALTRTQFWDRMRGSPQREADIREAVGRLGLEEEFERVLAAVRRAGPTMGKEWQLTTALKGLGEMEDRVRAMVREIGQERLFDELGIDAAQFDETGEGVGALKAAFDALVESVSNAESAMDKVEQKAQEIDETPINLTPGPDVKTELDKIVDDLQFQVRLQELLNQEKSKEAELLRIQQRLGRELTDQERERLGVEIERLHALREESNLARSIERASAPRDIGTALQRFGGVIGTGMANVADREGLNLDRRRNQTLENIDRNIRRIEPQWGMQ